MLFLIVSATVSAAWLIIGEHMIICINIAFFKNLVYYKPPNTWMFIAVFALAFNIFGETAH